MDLDRDTKIHSFIGEFFTSNIEEMRLVYAEIRDDFYNYMLDYYRKYFTGILEGKYKKYTKVK